MAHEIFYRYEDVQYAPCLDEYDDPIPGSGRLQVQLREYRVLKHTPCGVRKLPQTDALILTHEPLPAEVRRQMSFEQAMHRLATTAPGYPF